MENAKNNKYSRDDDLQFAPMARARYERKVSIFRRRHFWLTNFVVEPEPGFLGIVEMFLCLMEDVFDQTELRTLSYFRIGAGSNYLAIHFDLPGVDLLRIKTVKSAIDDALSKSKTTCRVCGQREDRYGAYPFEHNRCYLHMHTTAIFEEDFLRDGLFADTKTALHEGVKGALERGNDECAGKSIDDTSTTQGPIINFLDAEKLYAFRARAKAKFGEKRERLEKIVDRIVCAGEATRQLGILPQNWQQIVDEFEIAFPNFSSYAELLRDQFSLSALGDSRIALPPTLFVGAPGIGKTEAANWLAQQLCLPFRAFDMACAQSNSPLSGSESFWSNSQEGCIFEMIAYQPTANPIVVLDELDKVGRQGSYDPLASLYGLLEPRTARNFIDLSIREFEIDASHINWIATANSIEPIPEPIRSRMTVLNIPSPSIIQLTHIAQQIYVRLRAAASWGNEFPCQLDPAVAEKLSTQSPRSLRISLQRALGVAARQGRRAILLGDILPIKEISAQRSIGFLAEIT